MTRFARDEHDSELFIRYRVTDDTGVDIFTEYFNTFAEANAYAERLWFDQLTESERKHRHVYVFMVKACASPAKADKEFLLNASINDKSVYDDDDFNEDGTFDLSRDATWDLFGSWHVDGEFDSENLPEEDEEEDG